MLPQIVDQPRELFCVFKATFYRIAKCGLVAHKMSHLKTPLQAHKRLAKLMKCMPGRSVGAALELVSHHAPTPRIAVSGLSPAGAAMRRTAAILYPAPRTVSIIAALAVPSAETPHSLRRR